MKKTGKKNPFRIINRALRDAKVKNLGISSGDWGVEEKGGRWCLVEDCACPLGLCLVGKKRRAGDTAEVAATRVLGQPLAWVRAFIDGVDGNDPTQGHPKQAFNFGQRIRAKYVLA